MKFVRFSLYRSFSTLADTLQEVLQGLFETTARNLGRWAKGMALRFGIGAALALVALFAAGSGLAEVLIVLGLPAYAGYLLVAALAGGLAVVLFKTGAKRRLSSEGEFVEFRRHRRPRSRARGRSFRGRRRRAVAARRPVRVSSGRGAIRVDGRRF